VIDMRLAVDLDMGVFKMNGLQGRDNFQTCAGRLPVRKSRD
jgi:hypothetical protein